MEFPFYFDGNEIEAYLQMLAAGSTAEGQIWRPSYGEADQKAKSQLSRWFRQRGFSVRFDEVGNLYARLGGSNKPAGQKTVLVGSHLDTVKNGGKYDGAAGILLGMFAAEALNRGFGPPKRRVEIVAMMEEEGSRYPESSYFGSRAINGMVLEEELQQKDEAGVRLEEAARDAGYWINRFPRAVRNDLLCYIEPHIEQGRVLEETGAQVGIVEAITGFALLTVRVEGRADHAGTTPMGMRQDALAAAVRILSRLPDLVQDAAGDTLTVGTLAIEPGSSNVVPQTACFTVDIRSVDDTRLLGLVQEASNACRREIARGFGVTVQQAMLIPPVRLDRDLRERLGSCAKELGLSARGMPSGAGHDCMHFARRVPSAMFFLPSQEGRSHCPEEYTTPEQLAYGARLLARMLYEIAWNEKEEES